MIREIPESEFGPFFELMAEVECGSHFDSANPDHVKWVEERIRMRYAAGTSFYGMFAEDGRHMGFAALSTERPLHTSWSRSELLDIIFFPHYRGKGHGSELLRFVEDEARLRGTYALFVSTYARSHDAIAFYGRNGYVPVAAIPDTNGPGDEGDVIMRKVVAKRNLP